MSIRKIIFYQKYATKPVILTDISDKSKEEIQKEILEVMSSKNISVIETTNDSLIIRPSEIQSVLITKNLIPEIENNDKQTSEIKKPETKYSETLKIEKK